MTVLHSKPVLGAALVIGLVMGAMTSRAIYLGQKMDRPNSAAIYDQDQRLINLRLSHDQTWRLATPSQTAARRWEQAVQCLEDKYFYQHPGVNPAAVLRSLWQWAESGRISSGASTIPMQLARMIHRLPRNLESKMIESLDAIVMSLFFSKQHLLNAYARLAPMGGNIEGIETGAQAYFRRGLDELNWQELATLLLLPQSPSRIGRWNDSSWTYATAATLRRLNACGVIDASQLTSALNQRPHSPKRHSFPSLAPHVADILAKEDDNATAWRTHLNMSLQQKLTSFALRQREAFFTKHIHNIAIGVAEISSGKIRGLIGNFDYFLDHSEQKIAAFDVLRSPGSTLKPLIYGIAIDDQLILPDSLLEDIPSRYGHYRPNNFNADFSGLIKAKTALSRSLNIPFIDLLAKMGIERMTHTMSEAGLKRRTVDTALGLSLAVGGIDVHFMDLFALYAGLARSGIAQPLELIQTQRSPFDQAKRFLSEAAAYLTSDALRQRDRPEADHLTHVLGMNTRIAWKTGTSQDRLDAWSIGYDDKYVVAVWLGNLNRMSSQYLVGSEVAAPLMFDVFAMLDRSNYKGEALYPPISVSETEVCALSGMSPGPACDHRIWVPAANGKVPPHRCKYHRHAIIDRATGLEISMQCAQNRSFDRRSVTSIPNPVRRWLGDRWIASHESAIGVDPMCAPGLQRPSNFHIESPQLNARYNLLPSLKRQTLSLPFRASGISMNHPLNCYINGERKALKFNDVLELNAGRHEIYCTDSLGEAAKTVFWVDRPDFASLGFRQ